MPARSGGLGSRVISSDEVFDARIVSGAQRPASAANNSRFNPNSSGAASITNCASRKSPRSVVVRTRPSAALRAALVSRSRATARSRPRISSRCRRP